MSWAFDKPKHGGIWGGTSLNVWQKEAEKLVTKDPFATEHDQHVSEAQQAVTEGYLGSEEKAGTGSYKNVWESAAEKGPFGGMFAPTAGSAADPIAGATASFWAEDGNSGVYAFGNTGTKGEDPYNNAYDPTANKVIGSVPGLLLDFLHGGHTNYAGGVFGGVDPGESSAGPALASAPGGAMAGSIWGTPGAEGGYEAASAGPGAKAPRYDYMGYEIVGAYAGQDVIVSQLDPTKEYIRGLDGSLIEMGLDGQPIYAQTAATASGVGFYGGMDNTVFGSYSIGGAVPEASGGDAFAACGGVGNFYDSNGDGKPDKMAAFYGNGSASGSCWFFGGGETSTASSTSWWGGTTSAAQQKDIWGNEQGVSQQYASYGVNGDNPWDWKS